MVGKSSVSALQEFCARSKFPLPEYDYITSDDGSFVCRITVLEMETHGNGRSKRDAKHHAAANAVKKLRLMYPDIDDIPQTQHQEIPTTDMIVTLRDYCVQHHHPLPIIDIVQQAGTPNAPEFTALCTVASIKRYAVSDKKKDARQKAALEIMRVIMGSDGLEQHMQVVTLPAKDVDFESERYAKFKTYRELTESVNGEMPGVLLCDRHNYYSNFFDELKTAALVVLTNSYENEQTQVMDLFDALKIQPKITQMNGVKERMLLIELNCDYDTVFAGPECIVYKNILAYFKDML